MLDSDRKFTGRDISTKTILFFLVYNELSIGKAWSYMLRKFADDQFYEWWFLSWFLIFVGQEKLPQDSFLS